MNEAQIEHWNGPEARRWVEQQDRYDRQLGPFADALLDAVDIDRAGRVLDIGCGCGTTTLRAAGEAAHAVGVDISAPMLERARTTAAAQQIANVEFVEADMQTHVFATTFDVAMSRFGVMFFDDPSLAFANIAVALRPGGQLVFVCWQELARNDWLLLPGLAAAQHLPLPDQTPGGPGPFSLADRDELRAVLGEAGFTDVEITPHKVSMLLGGGGTIDDSLSFLLNTGVARAMFDGADPDATASATAAARHVLADHYEEGDGVRLGAATWIVKARKPN
jgi:SAM-dependent methyltransferase